MALAGIPQNLCVQQGNGQVYLDWSLSAGATSYSVQRSLDGVNFTVLATPTLAEYLDTTVSTGIRYYYRVASVNTSGTSSYSPTQDIIPTITGALSLAAIRSMAQDKADRKNSNFVTKAEWNEYINQSAFELYDLLITAYEDYAIADPYQFVTTSTDSYALPSNFYKLLGVDCGLSSAPSFWVSLKKFDFIERNRYAYPNQTGAFSGQMNLRYRILGNQIKLIPQPTAGQQVRLWFVPRMPQLLKDTDTLDGVSGWTEYVIVDAAIKALDKEESDSSALMVKKQALLDRIEASAQNRDAGQADTVSDVRSNTGSMGGGYNIGEW